MPRFHFDLRHLPESTDLRLMIGDAELPLRRHDESSLGAARGEHSALAALPEGSETRFSHFSDTAELELPGDAVSWVRVVKPPPEGVHLPQVVQMTHYIPEAALAGFFESQFQRYRRPVREVRSLYRRDARGRPRVYAGKLHALGVTELPRNDDDALELLLAAQTLVEEMDTAASLVAHHPDLANIQPFTAAVVRHDHILPDPNIDPDQYNAVQVLANAIRSAGEDWSPVIECTDQHGNPLEAGYDLDDGSGKGFKKGQQLYTYSLKEGVQSTMAAPIAGAQRTASDDGRLRNKTWSQAAGTSVLVSEAEEAPAPGPAPRVEGAPQFKWTVDRQTPHHGVSVDKASIRTDPKFSIDAGNSYLRTLYVGYMLLDNQGKPTGKVEKLYSVSATNTILGIPMPTDPTAIEFDMGDAPRAELLFGSLGVSDWVEEVSTPGALLTGLWQYGIPVVFLVAGKAVTSTKLFNKIVNDRDLVAAAIGIAFPIVGGGAATAAALTNWKKIMFSLADTALSIALQKGMEALGKWLLAQVAAGAISNAFGPVGWIMRAVAVVLNVEQMAVTTGEVLSSPGTIRIRVSRALDVALELHPDPAHGEVGDPSTAIWPTIATRYLATLEYQDGTNFQLAGPMPATSSSQPLALRFVDVPAGGLFRITAGLFSASGWLAGAWQSDWIKAEPNRGTTLDLGKEQITENLVPLAPDTQYVYEERIAYADGEFVWEVGEPPTVAPLDCEGSSTLCDLVGITINNSAFQVGYAWRASGQDLKPDSSSAKPSNEQLYAVQNLSVLAEPSSRLITTGIGFTQRPQIAYAPSTTRGDQIDQNNFVLDPRGGGMNLRRVKLSEGQTDFGFGDPDQPSWGRFPLQNLDALAVHPSNSVIGASFKDQKLMLLPLPPEGTADDKAPEAVMVSGKGIRQGLMNGPEALAVAPDGRVLVLESANRRVQAFDLKGNPVPGFTWMPTLFTLDTGAVAADLDEGKVPELFVDELVESASTFELTLAESLASSLDRGKLSPEKDPVIEALAAKGIDLAYDADAMSDPAVSAQIEVVEKGRAWTITDPRGQAWRLLLDAGTIGVYGIPAAATVTVQSEGRRWLISDTFLGTSWQLDPSTAEEGRTLVDVSLSYFPLNSNLVRAPKYLDMAVEAEGHVYVLFRIGDGSADQDYVLDIYSPQGKLVSRTPDPSVTADPQNLVAARIAVDIWRNLYGLAFGRLAGHPKVQPDLAHWVPTPPLFSLPLSVQKELNDQNIGAVAQAFAAKGVVLSTKAFITVVDPEGTWEVKDGPTIYHLYRSGDGVQVYSIPA